MQPLTHTHTHTCRYIIPPLSPPYTVALCVWASVSVCTCVNVSAHSVCLSHNNSIKFTFPRAPGPRLSLAGSVQYRHVGGRKRLQHFYPQEKNTRLPHHHYCHHIHTHTHKHPKKHSISAFSRTHLFPRQTQLQKHSCVQEIYMWVCYLVLGSMFAVCFYTYEDLHLNIDTFLLGQVCRIFEIYIEIYKSRTISKQMCVALLYTHWCVFSFHRCSVLTRK